MLLTYLELDNIFQTTKFNYVEKTEELDYHYYYSYLKIPGITTKHLYIRDCPEWLYNKNHFHMQIFLHNHKMFKIYVDYCIAVDQQGIADFIVLEVKELTQSQIILAQI